MNNLEFPKRIMLEVTNLCNNKCVFCASSISGRKRGIIENEFAKKIIAEAYGGGDT